jgi:hypothetical protein
MSTPFEVESGLIVANSLIYATNGQVSINGTSADSTFKVTGTANITGNTTVGRLAIGSNTVLDNTSITVRTGRFYGNVVIDGNITVNGGATFVTVANAQTISEGNSTVNATSATTVSSGQAVLALTGTEHSRIDLISPSGGYDGRLISYSNGQTALVGAGGPLRIVASGGDVIIQDSSQGNVSIRSGTLFVDTTNQRVGISCTAPVVNATLDSSGAIKTQGYEGPVGGWLAFNAYYNGTNFASRSGANGVMIVHQTAGGAGGIYVYNLTGNGVSGGSTTNNLILSVTGSLATINTSLNVNGTVNTTANVSVTGVIEVTDRVVVNGALTINTTAFSVGNTVINSQRFYTGNATDNSSLNSTSLAIGTSVVNTALVQSNVVKGLVSVNVGSNVSMSTDSVFIGNSTVNVIANSTQIRINGSLLANSTLLFRNTLAVDNSISIGTNVTANSSLLRVGNSTVRFETNSTYMYIGNATDGDRVLYDSSNGTMSFSFAGAIGQTTKIRYNGLDTGSANISSANIGTATITTASVQAGMDVTNTDGSVITVNYANTVAAAPYTIIDIRRGNVSRGSITENGSGTVSYNAFMGSHWSQLKDKRNPEIPIGTVVETIDEMVEWDDGEKDFRLPKFKVSTLAESTSVYGVFGGWDKDGDAEINSLGLSHIRINKDVEVTRGDLIVSNGDGTGKVKKGTTICSKTVGKVMAAVKVKEYEDGSYLVPCVLYCG